MERNYSTKDVLPLSLNTLLQDPQTLREKILTQLEALKSLQDILALEDSLFSKKQGLFPALFKELKTIDAEKRGDAGRLLHELQSVFLASLANKKQIYSSQDHAKEASSQGSAPQGPSSQGVSKIASSKNKSTSTLSFDPSLPLSPSPFHEGRLHPLTLATQRMHDILNRVNMRFMESPHIETEERNFTNLNFPPGHPARQMHDTFYIKARDNDEPQKIDDDNKLLLRTHTTAIQLYAMRAHKPPLRIFTIGRTFRADSNATHTPQFHQVDGVVIDKTSHLGHLKGMLTYILKSFFELDDLKLRFRPSFFPFTRPSLEVDIAYTKTPSHFKLGHGEEWLEILGCGMIHPNVLKAGGLDSEVYQGFAFGIGLDRLVMLKGGIHDLRALFATRIPWLQRYGQSPASFI